MKVYTEVNYIWKDDKLVQTDSQSFDYEGEVEQCHTRKTYFGINIPHPHGGEAGKITAEGNRIADTATTNMEHANLDKPGGDVKRFTDWFATLDSKVQKGLWGHSSYDDDSETGTDQVAELFKGSRPGFQGRGGLVKANTDDKRRGLANFDTKTLLTQGQKAKKLA